MPAPSNVEVDCTAGAGREHIGADRENKIVPLRWLLDAGVHVCFATDNVPILL